MCWFTKMSTNNLYTSVTANCDLIAELAVPPGRTEVADFDKDGDLAPLIGINVFENKTISKRSSFTAANLNSLVERISENRIVVNA